MGSKGSESPPAQYTAPPTTPEFDPAMIFGMMESVMAANAESTNNIMAQQAEFMEAQQAALPSSDPSVPDWEARNASLQEKIDKQVEDSDLKRRGVLGTILTSIDDDDEANTVTSLLAKGDD